MVALVIVAEQRQIFSGQENVHTEAVASLVVVSSFVVVEDPACAFITAGLVHEMPDPISLVLPESPHSARVAMLPSEPDIDPALCIERRHNS